MAELTWNGQDDRIPDEGLANILGLVERLPAEFELGSTNASQRSVTVTIRFPYVDPHSQIDALERVLQAATVLGTTARNLRHERDAREAAETALHLHHRVIEGRDDCAVCHMALAATGDES